MADTGEQTTLNQADVASILDALRVEVRAQRMAEGQLEASPLERDLQRSLDEIELHRVVSAHWPLLGKSIPQRAIGLVNKLVRRYLRWYINPIVEQQNAYNDAVARALRLLADAYIDLGEQVASAGRSDKGDKETRSAEDQRVNGVDISTTQIQALVQVQGATEPPARFPDLDLRAIEPQIGLREQVSAHWPLVGTTMPQRTVAQLNKLVRRYLRWYVNPIVEQQNAANAAITAALVALIRLDAERRAQVASVRSQESEARSQKKQILTPDS